MAVRGVKFAVFVVMVCVIVRFRGETRHIAMMPRGVGELMHSLVRRMRTKYNGRRSEQQTSQHALGMSNRAKHLRLQTEERPMRSKLGIESTTPLGFVKMVRVRMKVRPHSRCSFPIVHLCDLCVLLLKRRLESRHLCIPRDVRSVANLFTEDR